MAQRRCSSSCWSTETEADPRPDRSVFGFVVRTKNGPNRQGERAANLRRWSAVNLGTLFADHPAERTALVTGGDRITYGQLSAEVEKTRGVLVSLGLEPGDRVAILCATNFRFVRAWFGILGAGMVAVPLNPQSPAPEIERELAQVGAKAVIAGPAGIGVLEQVDRSVVPTLKHVLRPSGVGLPDSVDLDVRCRCPGCGAGR